MDNYDTKLTIAQIERVKDLEIELTERGLAEAEALKAAEELLKNGFYLCNEYSAPTGTDSDGAEYDAVAFELIGNVLKVRVAY